MKAAVLINLSSNNGNACKKWLRIKSEVKKRLPEDTIYICYEMPVSLKNLMKSLISNERVTRFISAGGDGSVNLLINSLAQISPGMEQFTFGAIGLGSSNDFLKPKTEKIKGIPVKLDFSKVIKSDLGKVTFSNDAKSQSTRYFAVNASLGFTAEGNRSFNRGDRIIRFLKPKSVNLAIFWTVLKTLFLFQNKTVKLCFNGKECTKQITNVSVAKNPNVSGSFRYDVVTAPDSGKLGFYLAEDFSKAGILKLLFNLLRNRFSQLKKCHVSMIDSIEIESDIPIALETDGEIYTGSRFTFSIVPKAISFAV